MDVYTSSIESKFKIFAPMLKASMDTDGKMRLHGIASSTVKDRHGDTISLSALSDMERSANGNLTIFLNHEYKVPEDVAGSVERALIRPHPQDPSIHDLVLDIVVNDTNPRAVDAWTAIQKGTQLGLSIGAMIPEGGATRDRKSGTYNIEHVELLETSLVGVPANPRSWVEYAVKSLNGNVTKDEEPSEEEALTAEEIEDQIEADAEIPAIEVVLTGTDGVVTANDATVTFVPFVSTGSSTTWTPDVIDATVNIKTPYADVSIDTGNRGGKPSAPDGSSQEAPLSAPEDEEEDESLPVNPWAAIGLSGAPEVEEIDTALQVLEPTVVASLRTSSELLRAITRELIDTQAALAEVTEERDQAMAAAEKVVANMSEILTRLSATPVGRRAVVREVSDKFASLKSVYSDEFLTLLKKG